MEVFMTLITSLYNVEKY